ncbi:PaaI family thioesterase [Rhodospirillaceae bacterium SYSU D60014]|uniref:PaaI family thioesterase n=1 Tax=Virgifigura deserti TaxID=2268457 RepID=UPI000E66C341
MQESLEVPGQFGRLVGYRLIAWREGYAEVALTVGPDHLNRTGVPHGGLLATLIDTACGYSGCYCTVPGNRRRAVTLSLNTQFVGQARAGDILTAVGRATAGGRRIFFTQCEVRDQAGRLIAQGEGVFRYRCGSETPEGEPVAER